MVVMAPKRGSVLVGERQRKKGNARGRKDAHCYVPQWWQRSAYFTLGIVGRLLLQQENAVKDHLSIPVILFCHTHCEKLQKLFLFHKQNSFNSYVNKNTNTTTKSTIGSTNVLLNSLSTPLSQTEWKMWRPSLLLHRPCNLLHLRFLLLCILCFSFVSPISCRVFCIVMFHILCQTRRKMMHLSLMLHGYVAWNICSASAI